MRRLSTAFALVILLTGCSANWHLKRAISKDPTILTQGVVIERVVDTIEVITPELRVDTLHRFSRDTVTTYVDRVKIRTKVDTVNKTVYVDVVCPGDTIYVPYEYDKTVIKPRVRYTSDVIWAIVAFIVVAFLLALFKDR
jgi:hypothetical protein